MRTNVLSGHAILERADIARLRCTGISAHGGVLVLWDEDFDERVIALVDAMTDAERAELVGVHERAGCVSLFWRAWVPRRFQVGGMQVAGDLWTAFHFVGDGCPLEFSDGCLDLCEWFPAGGIETATLPEGETRVAC